MDEFRVVRLYFNSEIHLFTESNLGITSKICDSEKKVRVIFIIRYSTSNDCEDKTIIRGMVPSLGGI